VQLGARRLLAGGHHDEEADEREPDAVIGSGAEEQQHSQADEDVAENPPHTRRDLGGRLHRSAASPEQGAEHAAPSNGNAGTRLKPRMSALMMSSYPTKALSQAGTEAGSANASAPKHAVISALTAGPASA